MWRLPSDICVNQAAQGVISSHDALVDLIESIGQFVIRLDIYTRIPLTPAMSEMIVKIMAALLSTVALATKELKQGRSSERNLVDAISFLTRRSQICEEISRREER
jgi:hypothetical protein